MKRSITNLEFIKGYLTEIEDSFIKIEKRNSENQKEYQIIKNNIKKISKIPIRYYWKLQIRSLNKIIDDLEKGQFLITKKINKIHNILFKLKDVHLLDLFSHSIETHIKKLIKKPKEKSNYYYLFSISNTYYCAYGKKRKILKATNIESMKNFLGKRKISKNIKIFPDINNLHIFFTEKDRPIYMVIIENEKGNRLAFFTQSKIIRKERIENLKTIESYQNEMIKFYFLKKGKKFYIIQY